MLNQLRELTEFYKSNGIDSENAVKFAREDLVREDLEKQKQREYELEKVKLNQQGIDSAVYHQYHCRLLNARYLKCFRASIYEIAEDNLAFEKDVEGASEGIKCDSYNIEINLVFKEYSWMLKFQSALHRAVGNTTSNKKPRLAVMQSRAACDHDQDNEDEQEDEDEDEDEDEEMNQNGVTIHDEVLSIIPTDHMLKRVFHYHYEHNSPLCDLFSDTGSASIYEPETTTISIERVGQMIENPHHSFFSGKNPEIAYIKDKAKSKAAEEKDENNRLHLSRLLHEAFDGINTQPSGFPWFVIKYISHQEQSIDYGALQQLFGNTLTVHDRAKRYYPTTVHIEFYDLTQANNYVIYLRDGYQQVDQNDPLKFEMTLYFSDPTRAKKYLDWKEKRTRRIWT